MTDVLNSLAQALNTSNNADGIIALSQGAALIEIPDKHRLFASGDICENFVLIAEGTARVQISTRTGREMILFRLEAGQSCALTTSCLLTNSPYYAEGIAETPLKLVSIPAASFRTTINNYPKLAMNLLENYAQRITQLTSVIDRLISRDLGSELKSLLLQKVNDHQQIKLSHQKIADELGSSREVISRKLKAMEKAGLLKLSRGQITLTKLKL